MKSRVEANQSGPCAVWARASVRRDHIRLVASFGGSLLVGPSLVADLFRRSRQKLTPLEHSNRTVHPTPSPAHPMHQLQDNGAFYYYQTENHQPGKRGPPYTPGDTYEKTLIDVKAYAESEGNIFLFLVSVISTSFSFWSPSSLARLLAPPPAP